MNMVTLTWYCEWHHDYDHGDINIMTIMLCNGKNIVGYHTHAHMNMVT